MKSKIHLIVAMGRQNQIGLNGTMPWHLSDDLKNFKKITSGHTIIMGRKTFDSIGRALPKRLNFVITSDPARITAFEVCSFNKLEKAIEKARLFDKDIFIIGGASIYRQALPVADSLIITHVDYNGDADTYFPVIDWNNWKIKSRKSFFKNEKNEYDFEVVEYLKK
jgi:dihydrofolate reductase